MSSSAITDKIAALVTPLVADLKLDLYDLEFNGGLLRVTVDTPQGAGSGVTLDQLSLLTRLIGRDLDHHDPIPGHYTLEVTSPGLERPLRTPVHFQKAIGRTVTVRLHAVAAEQRRIQGVLIAADEDTATIRVDDAARTERVVPLASIDRARTVFVWGGAEKPGKPTAKKPGKGSKVTGGAKPPKGLSDELDAPIRRGGDHMSEEANA